MKHESIFPTGIATGGGLTKREYFTLKIMHALLSADNKNKPVASQKDIAETAIGYADALIEALDKPDEG